MGNGDTTKDLKLSSEELSALLNSSDDVRDMFRSRLGPMAMQVYVRLMCSQDEKIALSSANSVMEIIGVKGRPQGTNIGTGVALNFPTEQLKPALDGLRKVLISKVEDVDEQSEREKRPPRREKAQLSQISPGYPEN